MAEPALTMTFRGGRVLRDALRQLPEDVRGEVLVTAAVAGGDVIGHAIQDRAPRGVERRRPETKPLAETVDVRVLSVDAAHVEIAIGVRARYGHLLEYGHQMIARGPSRQGLPRSRKGDTDAMAALRRRLRTALKERRAAGSLGFVAARPFIRPAVDETQQQAVGRFADVLGASIAIHAQRRLQQSEAA